MLPVSYKSQTPLHAHQGVQRGLVMRSAFVLRLMPKTISLPFSCLTRLSLDALRVLCPTFPFASPPAVGAVSIPPPFMSALAGLLREAPGRGQAAPPASGAAYASRGPAGHAPRTNCPQSETCFFPCCHTPSPAETSGAKLASVQRELMILPPSPSPQRFCLRPRRDRAPSRCRVRRRPQCASTSRFLPGGSGSATPRPACREAG